MFIHRCRQQHAYTERIRWFRLIHSIFFFIFRYYFVVHDSGMVPAKLPALLRSSLLQFCLFKTKKRIFTEFSVSFRERFTYFVYKKATIFFHFPVPWPRVAFNGERNRLGRVKIVFFHFRGNRAVSNETRAVASNLYISSVSASTSPRSGLESPVKASWVKNIIE